MKKLLAILLIAALMLPGLTLAEASFTYLYLDCRPFLAYEGRNIPFVILSNDPTTDYFAAQADYAGSMARRAYVYSWNGPEQRYTQLSESIQNGVNGYNSDAVIVHSYHAGSRSGMLSFKHFGQQMTSPLTNGEQFVVTGDEYYEYVAAAVDLAAADYAFPGVSQKQSARDLHDWLCNRIAYEDGLNRSWNEFYYQSTGYGAIHRGRGKCDGYANAYTLLLRSAGIEAFTLRGTASGSGHAWNIARLDGQWLFIDVTWDDQDPGVRYDYFALTKSQMDRDHHLDDKDEAFVRYLMDGRFDQALRNAGW